MGEPVLISQRSSVVAMSRSTRSRAGAPKDRDGGLLKDGTMEEALPTSQILQKPAMADRVLAADLGPQGSAGDKEVSPYDSPSTDSDCDIVGMVEPVEKGDLCSEQVLEEGGSVADQVFVELPHSKPDDAAAADVNQSGAGTARVNGEASGAGLKAPWVNLFRDNRNLGKGIKLDVVVEDGDMVLIEEKDVDVVEESWGYCLVGQFAGKFPGTAAIRSLREGWKVKCTNWIHRSGWIVFKFQSEEDRMSVLNGGPYFAYGRNLMLKLMPRCFRFGGEDFATVPVWVKLPDLPLDCWNDRALSKIVSRVGKPITTDKLTRTKERLSYARVLVEVDASKDLVTSVEMRLPTGVVYSQLVVFEVIPKYCKKCRSFGHREGDCKKATEGGYVSAYGPNRKTQNAGDKAGNGEGTVGGKGNAAKQIETAEVCVPTTMQSGGLLAGSGMPAPTQGAALDKGKAVAAEDLLVGGPGLQSPAQLLTEPAVVLSTRAKGGDRPASKGKSRKTAGQQAVSAVQHRTEDEGPALRSLEESLPRLVGHSRSSGGRGKEGMEGSKSGAGSGVGVSLKTSKIDSIVQGVKAVDAGSGSQRWAKECDTGEGSSRALDRPASFSSVSKVKQKGKASQSSK